VNDWEQECTFSCIEKGVEPWGRVRANSCFGGAQVCRKQKCFGGANWQMVFVGAAFYVSRGVRFAWGLRSVEKLNDRKRRKFLTEGRYGTISRVFEALT